MKKRLWLVSAVLLCCVIFAAGATAADYTPADGFAGGTGTESDPYRIATAEQLAYLAESVNSGTTYAGEYIRLTADIVLNDTSLSNWKTTAKKWTPIGTSDKSFSGTFDGGGYTISGLYIYAQWIQQRGQSTGLMMRTAYKNSDAFTHRSFLVSAIPEGGVQNAGKASGEENESSLGEIPGRTVVDGLLGVVQAGGAHSVLIQFLYAQHTALLIEFDHQAAVLSAGVQTQIKSLQKMRSLVGGRFGLHGAENIAVIRNTVAVDIGVAGLGQFDQLIDGPFAVHDDLVHLVGITEDVLVQCLVVVEHAGLDIAVDQAVAADVVVDFAKKKTDANASVSFWSE